MAARLPLHRAFFLKSVSGSIPSLWALKITPLRSSVCSFSSDAKPDSSDPAPGFSPANVSTLDDVTVSASLIESGDALLTKPRVANLPEDLSLEALEAANRIPSPPEKVKPVIPLPSLIKLQKGTRQDPQLIVDAIRLVKVMLSPQPSSPLFPVFSFTCSRQRSIEVGVQQTINDRTLQFVSRTRFPYVALWSTKLMFFCFTGCFSNDLYEFHILLFNLFFFGILCFSDLIPPLLLRYIMVIFADI